MRVKICGITTLDAGLAATDAGADYLGFVFVPGTRRYLDLDAAERLLDQLRASRPVLPRLVGLFLDAPLAALRATVDRCGLEAVQLCGDETPEYCSQAGVPVIRTLRPRSTADLAQFEQFSPHVERLLFDTYHAGLPGGSGTTGDWELARHLAMRFPLFLAGGLDPANVAAAIEAVRPWGVDTSSGVETNGKKDVDKIRAFITAAKRG